MEKWEYLVKEINLGAEEEATRKLNGLGEQGWESVVALEGSPDPLMAVMVFKKPKSN